MSDNRTNNTITASRMGALLRCPRAHFWQYEVGLVREKSGQALVLGSAWHRAMEAWNKGYDGPACLEYACAGSAELNEYAVATIAGLFKGYVARWGRPKEKLHDEIPFRHELNEDSEFDVAGVIDTLGSDVDGLSVLLERKTSSASVRPDSKFWLRLRFNSQVYQYVLAARLEGWDIRKVLYDVVRKPCIAPCEIPELDADGKKVVVDQAGNRVFLKNGEPRQSADKEKGYSMVSRKETPEEFCDRLASDCVNRPDFYFARREVPILDGDLDAFVIQREQLAGVIAHFRTCASHQPNPEDAWPRAVSEMNCNFCSYQSFCLLNSKIDVNHPPEGFAIKPFNPELERNHDIDSSSEETAAAAE